MLKNALSGCLRQMGRVICLVKGGDVGGGYVRDGVPAAVATIFNNHCHQRHYYDSAYLGIDKFMRIRLAIERNQMSDFGKSTYICYMS